MQAHRHALVDAVGVGRVEVDVGVLHEHALLVGDQRDQADEAEQRREQEHVHLLADAAEAPQRLFRFRSWFPLSQAGHSSSATKVPPAQRAWYASAKRAVRRRLVGPRPAAAVSTSSSGGLLEQRAHIRRQALLVQRHLLGQLGSRSSSTPPRSSSSSRTSSNSCGMRWRRVVGDRQRDVLPPVQAADQSAVRRHEADLAEQRQALRLGQRAHLACRARTGARRRAAAARGSRPAARPCERWRRGACPARPARCARRSRRRPSAHSRASALIARR